MEDTSGKVAGPPCGALEKMGPSKQQYKQSQVRDGGALEMGAAFGSQASSFKHKIGYFSLKELKEQRKKS